MLKCLFGQARSQFLTDTQILLAWVANSFPRPLVKRSVVISFTNMIGNTANIYGTYMYVLSPTEFSLID